MPKITSKTARTMARKSALKKSEMQGRYIVAYRLDRKNAKRHECFRSNDLSECYGYILNHKNIDRHYWIFDYDWSEISLDMYQKAYYEWNQKREFIDKEKTYE